MQSSLLGETVHFVINPEEPADQWIDADAKVVAVWSDGPRLWIAVWCEGLDAPLPMLANAENVEWML